MTSINLPVAAQDRIKLGNSLQWLWEKQGTTESTSVYSNIKMAMTPLPFALPIAFVKEAGLRSSQDQGLPIHLSVHSPTCFLGSTSPPLSQGYLWPSPHRRVIDRVGNQGGAARSGRLEPRHLQRWSSPETRPRLEMAPRASSTSRGRRCSQQEWIAGPGTKPSRHSRDLPTSGSWAESSSLWDGSPWDPKGRKKPSTMCTVDTQIHTSSASQVRICVLCHYHLLPTVFWQKKDAFYSEGCWSLNKSKWPEDLGQGEFIVQIA